MTPHEYLQSRIEEILLDDPWFDEHRVRIIKQNSQDIAELISRAEGEASGISLVITYDRETSIRSRPPQLDIGFSILCTEFPALNRAAGDFATALDAAARVRKALAEADPTLVHQDTVHATPGYGMLVATSKYQTRLTELPDDE